jgi:hypothetical protein
VVRRRGREAMEKVDDEKDDPINKKEREKRDTKKEDYWKLSEVLEAEFQNLGGPKGNRGTLHCIIVVTLFLGYTFYTSFEFDRHPQYT